MAIAKGRYATILNETGEVTNIQIMEGVAPEINGDTAHRYTVEEVDGGVMIGMVRGGPKNAVGGFGFPEGQDIGDRHGTGVTRIADSKAAPVAAPTSHEKIRAGDENPHAPNTAADKAQPTVEQQNAVNSDESKAAAAKRSRRELKSGDNAAEGQAGNG